MPFLGNTENVLCRDDGRHAGRSDLVAEIGHRDCVGGSANSQCPEQFSEGYELLQDLHPEEGDRGKSTPQRTFNLMSCWRNRRCGYILISL